jgi:S1-C subfamily serine protease
MTPPTLIAAAYDSMVSIKALIPEDAMSAGLLGTERVGHGVRIREDGLIATIGYVINEAEQVWIGARDGSTVPGVVVGYDFDSGFGLVMPTLPFAGPVMPMGSSAALSVGDDVTVLASGRDDTGLDARVVAKQEFAGRWEYLLEEAIFTSPPHDSWSGAALIDSNGRLCGLGSLVIQEFAVGPAFTTVNMFVPIELLAPIVNEICEHGRRLAPPRPWLGMLVHDFEEQLQVVGVYRNCPADRAGLKPGDLVMAVGGKPVLGLSNLFRQVWRLGDAGVEVPFTVLRDSERLEIVVRSADRAAFQRKGTVQ